MKKDLLGLETVIAEVEIRWNKQNIVFSSHPSRSQNMLPCILPPQGLIETWRKKLDSQTASKTATQTLKNLSKMSFRGDVYCVLKCESQIKRTALAKGHQNPVWKEDVAFKSVQISSELQV